MKYCYYFLLFSLPVLAMEQDEPEEVKDSSHLPRYDKNLFEEYLDTELFEEYLDAKFFKNYLKKEKSFDYNTFVSEAINRRVKGFLSNTDNRFVKNILSRSEFSQSEAQIYADMGKEWWHNVKKLSAKEKIILYFLQDEYLRDTYSEKYLADDHYINMLAQALDAEKEYKDKIVFYHGVDPLGSFMYDVLTHVRAMIYGDKNLTKEINIFRGNDKPFALFHNVHEFIDAFTPAIGKINNYKKLETKEGVFAYPDMGLSANMFLLGSKGRSNSETFSYFYDLYSATAVPYQTIFNNTMKEMGLSLQFSDFLPIYERYMTSKKDDGTIIYNGKLSQIFIDPQVVDAMAYLATAGGGVALVDNSYSVLKIVRDLRKDQASLTGIQDKLSKALFDGVSVIQSAVRLLPDLVKNDSIRNYTDYGINQIQIRLFLKPEIEHDPRYFKVKTYWRRDISTDTEKQYHKAIKNILYPHISTWIKEHQTDNIAALARDPRPNMLREMKTMITSKKDHEYDLNCKLDQSYQDFIQDHMNKMGKPTINFANYRLINFNDLSCFAGNDIISLRNLKASIGQGLAPYADYATYKNNAPLYVSFNDSCDYPNQGWKLHVSAMPHSAEKIARLILPYLDKDVSYKLYGSLPLMRTMWYDDEASMSKTQIGKFITIYPQNIGHAKYLAEMIDAILLKAINSGDLDPIKDFIPLYGDARLGLSGGLWTRYGVMAGHNHHNMPPPYMLLANFDFTPTEIKNNYVKQPLMINKANKANPLIIDNSGYPWPNFMNEWPSDIPHPFGDMPLIFTINDDMGNMIKQIDWSTRPTLPWEVYVSSLRNNM